MNSNISQKKLRKVFGFDKDREGLIKRYLNERNNWETHIQNTKQYILDSSEDKEKGICVILGSGWWIDLPYAELAEMFSELMFIDITHPAQIINKTKQFSNIKLLTADISGTLTTIYKLYKEKKQIDNINNLFKDNKLGIPKNITPDFVVSLNILNQLSFFPKIFFRKKKLLPEYKISKFAEKTEQNHIKHLPKKKSCLITDYCQYEYSNKNALLNETKRLKIELPINNSRKEWVWDFDLSGNFIKNRNIKFKVAALQV